MVESGVIRLEPSHHASFRQNRDKGTADTWLTDATVAANFEDGVQNSSGGVIPMISVVQREIGAGRVTNQRVPMNHRVRRPRAGRMRIMHMERRQQRERPEDGDGADHNDESNPS